MRKSRLWRAIPIVMVLVLVLNLGLVMATPMAAQPADSPWPMFGQNPQRTGQSPYTGPELPELEWSFTTDWEVNSSPAIGADGTIYVGSLDGNVYALNPDGSEKWRFTTGSGVDSSPAIGADGTIYVGSNDYNLYALNPDGSEKWRFTTGLWITSSPAIGADGTIYVGSLHWKDHVYALNPDGSEQWRFNTGGWVASSPAIGADGTIYVGSGDSNLYALNPDGSEQWRFTTGGSVQSSPAVGADGAIYVGSWDHNLYAVNPDGSEQWRFTTGGFVFSSPAIGADGAIYVGSLDGNVYALNPDGSEKWRFTTGGGVRSSPAVGADGTIYVGSYDYNLYALNPDGSEKWRFTTEEEVFSSPAVGVDGTIYVGSKDWNLYALGRALVQYELTIDSTAGGLVTTPGEGTFTYPAGTVVDLVAEADAGYHFVNWTGDVGSIADVDAASTTITMTDDYSITASFEPEMVTYELEIDNTEGGEVTTPGEGTFTYAAGTVVGLVAEADAGYVFVNWTGDVGTIANVDAASTTITMNDDYSITANFEPELVTYELEIDSTEGGEVTTPGEGTFTYAAGAVVGLVAEADAGYVFVNWTGDVGTIADVDAATTTITMTGDYAITANFAEGVGETRELHLQPGWNMVSVPIAAGDMSTGAVFHGVVAVYAWNPATRSYYVPETILPCRSYWVAVTAPTTITVTGMPVSDWTCDILAGWNMVGSLYQPTTLDHLAVTAGPDALQRSAVYWWGGISYQRLVEGQEIVPGRGYWVASSSDCTVMLSLPP